MVIARYLINYENVENPVDEAFIKFIVSKKLRQKFTMHSKKWSEGLEEAVRTFSDIQVLTGIAILLSGFLQLPLGISVYHWEVVVALAWFSSLTHLLTLTSLRDYLRTRLKVAIWRAVLMGIVVILLAVALGPTGYVSESRSIMATPAICLFSIERKSEVEASLTAWKAQLPENEMNQSPYDFGSFNLPLVVLSIGFLVMSYIENIVALFTTVPETLEKSRTKISKRLKIYYDSATERRECSTSTTTSNFWGMKKALVLLIYVLSKAFYEIGSSMLWQVRTTRKPQC